MSHNSAPLSKQTAQTESAAQAPTLAPNAYQAPAIESVVAFDDLQREVLYAGTITSGNPPL